MHTKMFRVFQLIISIQIIYFANKMLLITKILICLLYKYKCKSKRVKTIDASLMWHMEMVNRLTGFITKSGFNIIIVTQK
jgi:hypothetical protein